MEALYLYLLKSSSLLALFFVAYHFLLRKETFFTSNRWFLLLGLFTSVVLPVMVYTKIIWVEPSIETIDWSQIPVTNSTGKETFEINWFLLFGIQYGAMVLFLILKIAFEFYSLRKILQGKSTVKQADHILIDTRENIAPFSYFNTIVYNSSLYNSQELENIIEHEKIHCDQNHTVDVLVARVFCAVFWFNPFIWWYKNAILQNLEFIADSEATKELSDKKAYQLTLLKITTHENCVAITNHFYQSLIKKRIVMLNKNQSKKSNSWKYALILPALVGFVFLFQIETIAQEKKSEQIITQPSKTNEKSLDVYKINKNTTDEELKEKSSNLKENYAIITTFSGIKRNSKNELTAIKVDLKKGKEIAQKMQAKGTEAINEFGIIVSKNDDGMLNVKFGSDETTSNQKSIRITPNAPSVTEKEIFINGKKVSKEELDRINPDDIATMHVIKNNNESTIRIVTKGKTTRSTSVFNTDIEKMDSELDNIDPNNVSIRQKTKDSYSVTKVTKEVNGVPINTEYYIDGKKVSALEAENMNPNQITSVDVKKEGESNKNSIHILTKSYINSKGNQQQPPMPPAPPIPPTFNFKAPEAPNLPKPPVAPKGSPEKGDKKEWATFEQKMNAFNKKMEAMEPQMKEFDKKMAEFDEQMKPFDAKMKLFEKNMKIYEKQMEEYREKTNENK